MSPEAINTLTEMLVSVQPEYSGPILLPIALVLVELTVSKPESMREWREFLTDLL